MTGQRKVKMMTKYLLIAGNAISAKYGKGGGAARNHTGDVPIAVRVEVDTRHKLDLPLTQ